MKREDAIQKMYKYLEDEIIRYKEDYDGEKFVKELEEVINKMEEILSQGLYHVIVGEEDFYVFADSTKNTLKNVDIPDDNVNIKINMHVKKGVRFKMTTS